MGRAAVAAMTGAAGGIAVSELTGASTTVGCGSGSCPQETGTSELTDSGVITGSSAGEGAGASATAGRWKLSIRVASVPSNSLNADEVAMWSGTSTIGCMTRGGGS